MPVVAETCNRAFGRYLKALRERRRLSLDNVYSLSQTFPEKINKGYLSRCENGHHRLAFSKVIALSRIYEVPADVLVERMELDMELDRVGSPDTEGMSYSELTLAGKRALDEGFKWKGYAYLRDAVSRATADPVRPIFQSASEQHLHACMNCGTAAVAVERFVFALHEFHYVETADALSAESRPLILERLSQCYRRLDQLDRARGIADEGIAEARKCNKSLWLGYLHSTRATIAVEQQDSHLAITHFLKAYKRFRANKKKYECATTVLNLAQAYVNLERFGAARRALKAAETLLSPVKDHRTLGLGRILLGEIEARASKTEFAVRQWKEAAEIGKRLNDRLLRFQAEFQLFKAARDSGHVPAARAIKRRLRRLSAWVPTNTPELVEFKKIAS